MDQPPTTWVQESAVRRDGRLVLVWHGSDDTFEVFWPQGRTYLGIYGSSDQEYAAGFGRLVRPMWVNVRKPFLIDMDDRDSPNYASTHGEVVIGGRIVGFYRHLTPESLRTLTEAGYDGISARYQGNEFFEVVAFDPNQVQWAGRARPSRVPEQESAEEAGVPL